MISIKNVCIYQESVSYRIIIFIKLSKTSKCSGSCNNINDPYAKICVPDVVKDLNVKVFNLMSRTNETRYINGMKHKGVNVNWMQVFVIINNVEMMINADANVKN